MKISLSSALTGAAEAPLLAQGLHIDPAAPGTPPPDRSTWSAGRAQAFDGHEMELFRAGLRIGELDVRGGVLDDLTAYHNVTVEEALRLCRDWEELSVQEWQAESRSDEESLLRFYQTQQSWSYDLLWYAYLQAEGYAVASSCAALQWAQTELVGRRHLDVGSGVGATSQLFLSAGWTSTLADVSSTLLDFARFRLERRGQKADYIDLAQAPLPAGSFDLITAVDTMAHVPDVYRTACELRDALAPGGVLLANIDARPLTPENAWHLYDDDLGPRYEIQRAGFRPIPGAGPVHLTAYRRVETGERTQPRDVADRILLGTQPGRALYRRWNATRRALHGLRSR